MPKIPDLNDLGARQVARTASPQTPISVDRTQGAKALQGLGAAIGGAALTTAKTVKTMERVKNSSDKLAYTQAKSEFLRRKIEIENSFDDDNDYQTFGKRYNEAIHKVKNETLSKLPNSQYKDLLGSDIDLAVTKGNIGVEKLASNREGDVGRGSLIGNIDQNKQALLQTTDEDTRADLMKSTNEMIESSFEKGYIDSETAVKTKQNFASDYGVSRLNLMDADQQLESLNVQKGKGDEVSFGEAGNWIDAVPNDEKIRIYNRAKSEVKAIEKNDINDQVRDIEQAASLGLTVPNQTITDLANRADSVGMDSTAVDLNKYAKVQDDANKFALKSIEQQKTELNQTGTSVETGKISNVDKYAALNNVLQNKSRLLKDDPHSYYEAHDIINETTPLNVSDPNSITENLDSRRIEAQKVKELEGNSFTLPLFTKEEIGQLKSVHETKTPEETAKVISNIGNQLNPAEKRTLAAQIGKEKDSEVLAIAMTLPGKQAENILIGNSIKGEVPPARVRAALAPKLEGFVFNANINESTQSGVYAYYKKLAFEAGDTTKEVDDDLLDQAIQEVVGEQIEVSTSFFGGQDSKIFSFRDESGEFVSENDFEDMYEAIDDDVLTKLNGTLPILTNGDIINAEQLKDETHLVSFGDGLYAPFYEGQGFLSLPDGQPYVIDGRKLQTLTLSKQGR